MHSLLIPPWLGKVCPSPTDLPNYQTPEKVIKSLSLHCQGFPQSLCRLSHLYFGDKVSRKSRRLGGVTESHVIPLSPGNEYALAPPAREHLRAREIQFGHSLEFHLLTVNICFKAAFASACSLKWLDNTITLSFKVNFCPSCS